jgi:hypothetical protein
LIDRRICYVLDVTVAARDEGEQDLWRFAAADTLCLVAAKLLPCQENAPLKLGYVTRPWSACHRR